MSKRAGAKPRLFAIWPVLLVEFERMKKRGHILTLVYMLYSIHDYLIALTLMVLSPFLL